MRGKKESETCDGTRTSPSGKAVLVEKVGGKQDAAFYGFRPFPHRGPAVTNELINRLRGCDTRRH